MIDEEKLGTRVRFFPVLCLAVGELRAGILLSYLIDPSHPERLSTIATRADLAHATGMRPSDVDRARSRLEAMNVVASKRAAGKLHLVVHLDVIAGLVEVTRISNPHVCSKKESLSVSTSTSGSENREQGSLPEIFEPVSFDDVLAGRFDTEVDEAARAGLRWSNKRVLDAVLAEWARVWGLDARRVKLTPDRARAFRAAIDGGALPSDFAKAVLGMRHDEWPDRDKHNDWHLVTRGLRRWVSLFNERGRPTVTRGRVVSTTRTVTAKNGAKVVVPRDYDWRDEDEFMAGAGYTFDVEERVWK